MTAPRIDSLSVLVIDEEPEILNFFAKILDANGMRALLARNAGEAIGIAKRGYVPIDLVLTDISLRPDTAAPGHNRGLEQIDASELVKRLRELRPDLRALFMSASIDSEMIRIELKDRKFQMSSRASDSQGLIESIQAAATAPLVQRMGSVYRQ